MCGPNMQVVLKAQQNGPNMQAILNIHGWAALKRRNEHPEDPCNRATAVQAQTLLQHDIYGRKVVTISQPTTDTRKTSVLHTYLTYTFVSNFFSVIYEDLQFLLKIFSFRIQLRNPNKLICLNIFNSSVYFRDDDMHISLY